jgi:hypothetical protein
LSTGGTADDWHRLRNSWRDTFRRRALKPNSTYRAPSPVIVEYSSLGDGSAFHLQDMGWRMVVDVLYAQLMERQTPRSGRDPEEVNTNKQFDALFVRQITYPYLAAWRLSIEVALKQALVDVHAALETALPSKVQRLLGGHDIEELWRRYCELIPQITQSIREMAKENDVALDAPGLDLSPADCQVAIDRIVHIDPDGQHLRYRTHKSGALNMATVLQIDLADTHLRLTHTYHYLVRCAGMAVAVTQIRECGEILSSFE